MFHCHGWSCGHCRGYQPIILTRHSGTPDVHVYWLMIFIRTSAIRFIFPPISCLVHPRQAKHTALLIMFDKDQCSLYTGDIAQKCDIEHNITCPNIPQYYMRHRPHVEVTYPIYTRYNELINRDENEDHNRLTHCLAFFTVWWLRNNRFSNASRYPFCYSGAWKMR